MKNPALHQEIVEGRVPWLASVSVTEIGIKFPVVFCNSVIRVLQKKLSRSAPFRISQELANLGWGRVVLNLLIASGLTGSSGNS